MNAIPVPCLSIAGLHAFHGPSHILRGVSFDVGAGRVVALLGRNGAGKTTTLRSIMNLLPPRAGTVCLQGRPLAGMAPFAIARRGMTLVLENRGTFPSLTVDEALLVAGRFGAGAWPRERVLALFPRLGERLGHRCGQLSGGEQQMVAIGRALMLNPRLLLLDEPTQGLAPIIVRELLDQLLAIKEEGMSILLVEQNVPFAHGLADDAVVLGKGAVQWSGAMSALSQAADVQAAWLGV